MEENHRRISRSVCWLAVKSETYWSLTGFPVKRDFLSLSAASRFYQNLHSALLTEKLQRVQIQDPHDAPEREKGTDEEEENEERKKTSVYKRRRKREQHETDGCHGDGGCSVPGLEDCLDLFT